MKKIRFGFSFLFLVLLCVVTGRFLILINYLIALVFHELAHVYIALKHGYSLKEFKISLFGVSVELNENIEDSDSFAINIAGPVVNILLCLLCVALYWLIPKSYNYLHIFCISNLTLAVFNLLPIYPLDGGKIFSSLIGSDKYKKINGVICLVLFLLCIICFVVSCFYEINLFFLLLAVFFATLKGDSSNKADLFKFSKSKKIEKVELLKTTGEETLFCLLKKIKTRCYTIFYCNISKPIYVDEDEIIQLSTQFPLMSKLKDCL